MNAGLMAAAEAAGERIRVAAEAIYAEAVAARDAANMAYEEALAAADAVYREAEAAARAVRDETMAIADEAEATLNMARDRIIAQFVRDSVGESVEHIAVSVGGDILKTTATLFAQARRDRSIARRLDATPLSVTVGAFDSIEGATRPPCTAICQLPRSNEIRLPTATVEGRLGRILTGGGGSILPAPWSGVSPPCP